MLGRRVLPVKICSCPKRDMDREERDTQLQKNTVFRRTKKCISEDFHSISNHHHHKDNDNGPPPKIIKLEESSTSTGLESENINNIFTLPVSDYFILYSTIQKFTSLYNI